MKIIEQYANLESDPSIPSIFEANYIGDFAIRLTLNNGHEKLVDLGADMILRTFFGIFNSGIFFPKDFPSF